MARGAGEGDTRRLRNAEEEQGPQTDDGQTGKSDTVCNTAQHGTAELLLYLSYASVSDTFYIFIFMLTIFSFSFHSFVHHFVL